MAASGSCKELIRQRSRSRSRSAIEAPRALYLDAATIRPYLEWPDVCQVMDRALRAVCDPKQVDRERMYKPGSIQPSKQIISLHNPETKTGGTFCAMSGYIENYDLPTICNPDNMDKHDTKTFTCTVMSAYPDNPKQRPSLSLVESTILHYDMVTGKLDCILEGTEITAYRAAASSIIATKHLYFDHAHRTDVTLAILGCGIQGRAHAKGICHYFPIKTVMIWNREKDKAAILKEELMRTDVNMYLDNTVKIITTDLVSECVRNADIIVTATGAGSPILFHDMLSTTKHVHINAVGAGGDHINELDGLVYAKADIYVDCMAAAKQELRELGYGVIGEVGEVLQGLKIARKSAKLTIYQALGMAIEDGVIAELVLARYKRSLN